MYGGLNRDLIALLRCPTDGAALEGAAADGSDGPILHGTLSCTTCARTFEVRDGIVIMRVAADTHAESRYEQEQRDQNAQKAGFDWEEAPESRAEIHATLAALQPLARTRILELGCGCGRYTQRLAKEADCLIALDFSLGSLYRLAERLSPSDPVALVCADVTQFKVAPGAFGRVFSTLTSNLPTAEHRRALNALAAEALSQDGRFVHSAHYYGLRERLHGEKKDGHYGGSGGIYRYLFEAGEIRAENLRHFERVACRRIQVMVPFLGRIRALAAPLAWLGERTPGLNMFAGLLLVTAQAPRSDRSARRDQNMNNL